MIRWSVRIQDADTGAVLFQQAPDDVLRTASVGKLLLLVRAAEMLADGQLDAGEPLTRSADDTVADSGIWQYLRTDTLPVSDVCELIGMASDNLATNVLLRRVGLDAVAQAAARRGLTATALHDRVRDVRGPGQPPTLSTGGAGELSGLLAGVHRGWLAGDPVCGAVHGWLAAGLDLSQVASGWGLDPLSHRAADRGLTLVHKTGTDDGVRADVGVLTGPARSIAYCVIANWDGGAPTMRDEVLARQRSIGLRIAAAVRSGGDW